MAAPDKRALRKAIVETGGIVTDIAKRYDVSRPTIYTWLREKDLMSELQPARVNMVQVAEANIYDALTAGDLDISKFVVERKGKQFGWTKQVDVGRAVELPPDVVELMDRMGIDLNSLGGHLLPILQEMQAEMDAEADE